MSNYATKTCYDCGIKNPANHMERVTESYTSGRSDNRVTAGNLAFAALGSNTAAKKVKRSIVANNRRSYTRNRTVWKCLDCSGHNDAIRQKEVDAKRAEAEKWASEERKKERAERREARQQHAKWRAENAHRLPLHWFKQLIAWTTLIVCALPLASIPWALGDATTEVRAGEVVGVLIFFGFPTLIAIKALWFRDYNKSIRAEKKQGL